MEQFMAVGPLSGIAASRDGFGAPGLALHAGLEQFAAVSSIFDAAEMVLYVADMDTHELLFMNSRAQSLWGGGHRIGQPCYKVLQAGQSGPCKFCTNAQLVENGRPAHPVVWEFQNTVTKRWYLCIDKAIPWSDGRLVRMEVAIDVTQRKLNEQFREQYVGVISHDLRSPLSSLDISASVLERVLQRSGVQEAVRPLQVIRHSARQMSNMIEDLLETTKLEAGQFKLHRAPFDLARLASAVADRLGDGASRAVNCEADGPAMVIADANRIERVLENLIGNSLRHSAPGLPVTVRVAAGATEATVTVTDAGAGIPADVLPKLFQRFYRGSAGGSGDGLGLGLYNSRLIIERHGGHIWADSLPGQGSTFGFSVPVDPGSSPG